MKIFVLLSLVFAAIFFSCTMIDEAEEVTFRLPYSSVWNVRTCRNGAEESLIVAGDSFTIEVDKEIPFACIASDSFSENPLGAIYPFSTDLTSVAGFPAEVLHSLQLTSLENPDATRYFLASFNWQRFMEECALLGKDVWILDKEYIVKKISSGKFTKRDLKKNKGHL